MLTGVPPFYSKSRQQIQDAILTKDPKFYPFHSELAIDLLSRLLEKDAASRLSDESEIKEHPFFADIDWEAMFKKEVPPPYKPKLDSASDIKHFDAEITAIPIESPSQHGSGDMNQSFKDDFDGFSFVANTLTSEL